MLQLTTLFGGDEHVLRTAGLTYAEYAREGFAQLMVVAALTLGVIALARRDDRALRLLLGLLCALTLVVLASALKRLGLYEEAFGFTRLRLLAHGGILWLGGLFVLVLAAGVLRDAPLAPARDGRAVGRVRARLRAVEPRRADRRAQRRALRARRARSTSPTSRELSPDATPVLVRLPGTVDYDPPPWKPARGRRRARRGEPRARPRPRRPQAALSAFS